MDFDIDNPLSYLNKVKAIVADKDNIVIIPQEPKQIKLKVKKDKVLKEKSVRSDKGKERNKYDSSLPPRYKSYLMRANKKKFEFEFTVEEFNEITSKDCAYCGNSGPNGIDRIKSSIGYLKSNSVPCCVKCNMMKHTLTQQDFVRHIRKICAFLVDYWQNT